MSVLCLVERDGAVFADASLRAVAVARSLAAADGGEVTAVVMASQAEAGAAEAGAAEAGAAEAGGAETLAAAGATELCLLNAGSRYAPLAWARGLQQLVAAGPVTAVLAAATDRGSEVLAHLGAMTGLPVAANCVSVVPEPAGAGAWRLVRQRWAGSVLEDAVLEAPCALLTVAADAVPPGVTAGDAIAGGAAGVDASAGELTAAGAGQAGGIRVGSFTPELSAADLRLQATESAAGASGVSLATARVVVGGGRGVGGAEGFATLEELAGLLGGVVGVSRVVTSQGWRPHRQQVGQTGTKISPDLYLACGISGAIQHMAGCQSAKHIVVINTDQDAPIIGRAEYAVIGDLHEVLPALIAAIRSRGSK